MIYFLYKNVPYQPCAVPVHLSEMVDFYWFETKKTSRSATSLFDEILYIVNVVAGC
jgi:hypothetical protein